MKSTDSKIASHTIQRSEAPFFAKESDRHFFGTATQKENTKPSHQNTSPIQARLNVGKPNDPFEREADAVADNVIQKMNEPVGAGEDLHTTVGTSLTQRKCTSCEQEEKLQKKDGIEDDKSNMALHRKPIFESKNGDNDKEEGVQRRTSQSEGEAQMGESGNIREPDLETNLQSLKGAGEQLPKETRHQMEKSIGADFSKVRIHNDIKSAELSKSLHAQAFTHGSDIYFNTGKYDTSSKDGQHLLAHELTHTLQQGEAKIDRKISDNQLDVQKVPTSSNSPGPAEGTVAKTADGFTITLRNFPLKRYANPYVIPNNPVMPKGKRDTDQKKIWLDGTKTQYEKFIDDMVAAGNLQNEDLLSFTLKSNTATKIIGNKAQITHETSVPFWDLGGNPLINEVEHAVDYQILGKDADNLDNLILLDRKSNGQLGRIVNGNVNNYLRIILDFYKVQFPDLEGVTPKTARKEEKYTITYDGFVLEPVSLGNSLISISNIRGTNTPFKPEFAEIKKAEIPAGHFLLKSSSDRTGYLLPYSPGGTTVGKFYLTTKVDAAGILKSITLDPIVDGGKFIELKKTSKVDIINEGNVKDVFLINSNALSARMKGFIGVKFFSPVNFEEPQLTPGFGMKASGKVDPTLDFLKDNNIDIGFELFDSKFTVKASISDIVKFPKPFEVTDTSLWIQISTDGGLSVGGDIGFKISKLGSGRLSMIKGTDTFGISGDFTFDSKKFEGSKLGFKYQNNKWSFSGTINVKDITGVKEGTLTVAYADEKITAAGNATLDVPGVDKIILNAVFEEGGNFLISGKAHLKSLPGIKSGGIIDVSISKKAPNPDFILAISGEVEPNLPKIPKLSPKLSFSYLNGLFKAEGKSDFGTDSGLITGNVTVGVTNANVTDGQINEGSTKKEISFYGNGKLTLAPVKGLTIDLFVKVDSSGVAMFTADLNASISPFQPFKPEPKSILNIEQDFPLFGIPFLSLNFHMALGAALYLEWDPLTIILSGKITNKTYDELINGKFDADLKLTMKTGGKVGLKVSISAGASVTVAVLKGGADLVGSLSLELNGEITGTLNASWGEKGFNLKGGTGEVNLNLELIPALNGLVYVDMDLFVSRSRLWFRETKSVEGKRIALYTVGVKVPFEFDEKNTPKPLDLNKITFTPNLDKKSAQDQANNAANPDGKAPPPVSAEDEKKEMVRQQIRTNFQNAGKNQSYDRYAYATDLRAKLSQKADSSFLNFISKTVEEEFKQIESDAFEQFKMKMLTSKDPISQRIQQIDAFAKEYSTVSKDDINTLKSEVNAQANTSSNNAVVQRKETESDDNRLMNGQQKKNNFSAPPQVPKALEEIENRLPKIKGKDIKPAENNEHKDKSSKPGSDPGQHQFSGSEKLKDNIKLPLSKENKQKEPAQIKPKNAKTVIPNTKNLTSKHSGNGNSMHAGSKDSKEPIQTGNHPEKEFRKNNPTKENNSAATPDQSNKGKIEPVQEKNKIKNLTQFVIEDNAYPIGNQIRKTEFLKQLEIAWFANIEHTLVGTGFLQEHFLFLHTSFLHLQLLAPLKIEQILNAYEPQITRAASISQLTSILVNRAGRAANQWKQSRNPAFIRDLFIGYNNPEAYQFTKPYEVELVRILGPKEKLRNDTIQLHPVAPTLVERKNKNQLFGLLLFGGLNLSEFIEYANKQADWFTETTLQEADRKFLWKLLTIARPSSPILSGVGDIAIAALRPLTDEHWDNLQVYCSGCDSRFHTIRLTPSGTLPERISLGKTLKILTTEIPGDVLELTVSETQLKQIQSESLIIPLKIYLQLFKPHLQETLSSGGALKGGDKSETRLLLDFVKAPGALAFLPLLGKVRNLHRFAPDALVQLMNNFSDFSHSKPVYLILYSGHDDSSAFIRSHSLFENLLKDKSKLVLMLEGQGSIQEITNQVPIIAKTFGKADATGTNQIAQVMIAGHGASRSIELAGTGNPNTNNGDVRYQTEQLDLDKNNAKSLALLKVLMDNMDPKTARIVFAGCEVGSIHIPTKNAAGLPMNQADIIREANSPANRSLADSTRDLAIANKKPGMPVEGAVASVALADSKSLLDATGNLHIDYTMDPTSFGMANVYVNTGKEPEGVMRAAVVVAASNSIVAANQLRNRLAIPSEKLWYDRITRIFVNEALNGVVPGAGVDIVKVNLLASMASNFLLSYWAERSIAFFGDAINPFPAIGASLYAAVLATPDMTTPAEKPQQEGRFILELAWSMMDPARAGNVINYLDTHPALGPDDLKKHLNIAWLNAAFSSGHLFPPGAPVSNGRIRLALAWLKEDENNVDAKAFLNTLVNATGPQPHLLLNVMALLNNPAEETDVLTKLGRIIPLVAPAGGGPALPATNADAYPNGKGKPMNDVRIETNVYLAQVIAPAFYLNVRKQPSLHGDPFTRLKRGENVQVMGFVHDWAAVDINGRLGFAHKHFLTPAPLK